MPAERLMPTQESGDLIAAIMVADLGHALA